MKRFRELEKKANADQKVAKRAKKRPTSEYRIHKSVEKIFPWILEKKVNGCQTRVGGGFKR